MFRLVALMMCYALLFSQTAYAGKLTLVFTNIKKVCGNLHIGLFNSAKEFPKGKAYKAVVVNINNNVVSYTFDNLPEGDYGIAVYHDENSDNTCNTNLVGYPEEPYGFSKNVKPLLSAPAFKDVKINVGKQPTNTTIRLQR